MEHFTAHRLRFVTEVVTPIELNPHQGSAVRGALYHSLTGGFCMHKPALEEGGCPRCPLVPTCPVAFLVATLDPRSDRGANVPRPYVVTEPAAPASDPAGEAGVRLSPGAPFEFGLTMFARALNLFPYVVLSMQHLESSGIGKRLPENGMRRGRFAVREIWAENPLTGERRPVLRQGDSMVQVPDIPITHAQVLACAHAEPAPRALTLAFLTPTRLVDQGRLMHRPDARVLVQRLFERLSALARTFCDTPLALDFRALVELARGLRLVADHTRWVELESYSTRLGRATPIGGFVGSAEWAAEGADGWAPFLPWLLWGQFTHVGKDAVKGNGQFRIEQPEV